MTARDPKVKGCIPCRLATACTRPAGGAGPHSPVRAHMGHVHCARCATSSGFLPIVRCLPHARAPYWQWLMPFQTLPPTPRRPSPPRPPQVFPLLPLLTSGRVILYHEPDDGTPGTGRATPRCIRRAACTCRCCRSQLTLQPVLICSVEGCCVASRGYEDTRPTRARSGRMRARMHVESSFGSQQHAPCNCHTGH